MPNVKPPDFAGQRQQLVKNLRRRGIEDQRVLDAIGRVRRENFVGADLRDVAYRDVALPIEQGQTISQPTVVAMMAESLQLDPTDRVLELGTGSGYAAAVLALLVAQVYTIEWHPSLADQAKSRLAAEGFSNVHVTQGHGYEGWPEHAPFDAISVAAGGRHVPQPLLDQLRVGGRLIMPVGKHGDEQDLVRIVKRGPDDFHRTNLGAVRFVPLLGEPKTPGL